MGESPRYITEFLDSIFCYGPFWVYLIILAACFVENLFPPFPGDSFMVAAGGLVAVQRLDFYPSFILVITGGVSSVMVMYYLGRRYGRDYFFRKNFRYFSTNDILKVEHYLRRWGALILIFSRFVVGFRSAIALGAGIGRYRVAKMFLYSLVSYIIFAGLLMYMGMALVKNFDRIEYYFSTYNRIVWPLLIVLVAGYIVHRFRRLSKKA